MYASQLPHSVSSSLGGGVMLVGMNRSKPFDKDLQIIPRGVEIPDGRLILISRCQIEFAGGLVEGGAGCLCDQHPPTGGASRLFAGCQQFAPDPVTAGVWIDSDPVQVEYTFGQITRTVDGKAKRPLPIPIYDEVVTAALRSKCQVFRPHDADGIDLFLVEYT